MKKIIIVSAIGVFLTGFYSCNKEVDLYQSVKTEDAYNTVLDVDNGVTGAYYALGSYQFLGMSVPALGDMASDVSVASASSGHFVAINQYYADEYNTELNDIWDYGYKVVDRCVRTIDGANALLPKTTSDEDLKTLYASLSQCYSLRALTDFYLVNIFGLPYRDGGNNTQLGIVLLNNGPIEPFTQVSRSTVEQTYAQILSDIQSAKDNYALYQNELSILSEGDGLNAFYINEAGIYALEARVRLFMKDYSGAATAAQTAINLRGAAPVSNETYVKMWNSVAITNEDIFTIAKSDNDNLSANALNTLYGSYKGTISSFTRNLLAATDIRKSLIGSFSTSNQPAKFQGTATAQAVSNIPIFRVSEMYLIMAEADAMLNDIPGAQAALFFTAKRNTAIATVADLPSDQAGLLTFIANENVREFFAEGHRWFNLRRTGASFNFFGSPFDVQNFVYPIPDSEVSAGFGVEQNPNWWVAIPTK